MDCIVCSKTGPIYRLVDGDAVGVCEQCVAQHLSRAVDDATCLYCEQQGDYDLVEFTGGLTAERDESAGDYERVSDGVVCRDHLPELRAEEP